MKVKCSQCGKMFEACAMQGIRPELVDWICSEKCRAKWEIMLEKTKWSYS